MTSYSSGSDSSTKSTESKVLEIPRVGGKPSQSSGKVSQGRGNSYTEPDWIIPAIAVMLVTSLILCVILAASLAGMRFPFGMKIVMVVIAAINFVTVGSVTAWVLLLLKAY